MDTMSYVYVLVYPSRGALKIGKANNTSERIKNLKLGEVDYNKSYHLSVSKDCVFLLERALHRMFSNYNLNLRGFDGATELFDITCYDSVTSHVSLIIKLFDNKINMEPLPDKEENRGIHRNKGNLFVLSSLYQIIEDMDGGTVTQQSLANMLGEKMNTTISLSTIKRAICALVEQGCVEIRRHGDESPCTYVAIRPLGVTLLQPTSRREKLIIQRNINSLPTTNLTASIPVNVPICKLL